MNKLDFTLNGGFPLDSDDLAWQQDGMTNVLAAILNAFGTGPYGLNGLAITAGSGAGLYNVAAGWVVIAGEAHYYPGGTDVAMPGGFALWGLSPVRDVDPAGEEVFRDLSVQNAWKRTTCAVVPSSPLPDEFWPFNGLRVDRRLRNGAAVPRGGLIPYVGSLEFFDTTGLGITGTPMEGWAVANGLNGTIDMRGMVAAGATTVPASGAPDRFSGVTVDTIPGTRYGRDLLQLEANQLPQHTHPLSFPSEQYPSALQPGSSAFGSGASHPYQPFPTATDPNESLLTPVDMRQPTYMLVWLQSMD
jgi:hypothetical protein